MKGAGVDETENLSGTTVTGTPLTWKMKVVKGGHNSHQAASFYDTNLQITTNNYGLAETPATIDSTVQNSFRNLLMGVEIGTSASTSYGKGNVLMGYMEYVGVSKN